MINCILIKILFVLDEDRIKSELSKSDNIVELFGDISDNESIHLIVFSITQTSTNHHTADMITHHAVSSSCATETHSQNTSENCVLLTQNIHQVWPKQTDVYC